MRLANLRNIFSEGYKVIHDKQRKPILRILFELINYSIKHKDIPRYYARNMLHREDARKYLDYYVGRKEMRRIRRLPEDRELIPFYENKVLFHQHFKESKLRMPRYIGYNLGKEFFSPGGRRYIDSPDSFCQLIEDMMMLN